MEVMHRMGWFSGLLKPTGPRRQHIASMESRIGALQAQAENIHGEVRNNIQSLQSGARVLDTMSGMLKIVAESTGAKHHR